MKCVVCTNYIKLKDLANTKPEHLGNPPICKKHIEEIIAYLEKKKKRMAK